MDKASDEFSASLRKYPPLATSDAQLLRECVWAIARASMDINPFPEEYLDIFLELLNQKKFLELGGAWYFIMLFGTKWQYLPNDQ